MLNRQLLRPEIAYAVSGYWNGKPSARIGKDLVLHTMPAASFSSDPPTFATLLNPTPHAIGAVTIRRVHSALLQKTA